MTQGFVTLDEVVKSYLLRSDKTTHDYAKLLAIAIDGLAELHYDVMGAVKSVEIEVNPSTNSIDFPQDYVNYTKIGVIRNGNLILFGLNPYMATNVPVDDCGNPLKVNGGNLKGVPTQDENSNIDADGSPWGYWFYGYGYSYTTYGHGGGYSKLGYYKEDRANRRILFDSGMTERKVVLEYVTSGYVPGETTLVDAQAKQCLMDWIHWQSQAFIPEKAQLSLLAKRTYAASRRLLSLRKTSISLNEFIQACRYGYKQTIKN